MGEVKEAAADGAVRGVVKDALEAFAAECVAAGRGEGV